MLLPQDYGLRAFVLLHSLSIRPSNAFIGLGITMYHPPCAFACYDCLSGLALTCSGPPSYDSAMGMLMPATSPECRASNIPWLESLSYCVKTRCGIGDETPDSITRWWSSHAGDGATVLPFEKAVPKIPPTTPISLDSGELNFTSLVGEDTYIAEIVTLPYFEYQEDMHSYFGITLLLSVLALTAVAGAYRFALRHYLSASSRHIAYLRSKFILPSLYHQKHLEPVAGNLGYVPTRLQSAIILAYVSGNIIFSAAPYKTVDPNAWYVNDRQQLVAYVANRTGVLSFANIAILYLLAGRNNVLMLLTGSTQSSFLVYHRWVARVAVAEALVHSIIYTLTYFETGGKENYYAQYKMMYYGWGVAATCAMTLMLPSAVLPFRLRFYQIFFPIHVILAVVTLVACWYHVFLLYDNMWGYQYWLYIAFAVWSFDRFIRFGRIVVFNWPAVAGLIRRQPHDYQARASIVGGTEFIYLEVAAPLSFKNRPGQHSFIHAPTITAPWESHPFSIIPTSISKVQQSILHQKDDPEKEASPQSSNGSEGYSQPNGKESKRDGRPSLAFLIRPNTGFTRRLHKKLYENALGSCHISILTEGPYGHSVSLRAFDRLILIAGGIGITGILGYYDSFRMVLANKTEASLEAQGRGRSMVLAWSAKEENLINWVRERYIHDEEGVDVIFRNTSQLSGPGRFDVDALLAGVLQEGPKTAVIACAPGGMADSVRRVVAITSRNPRMVIQYFEEEFAW